MGADARRPVLGSGMHDLDVREPAGGHRPLEVAAVPDRALDQRDPRSGQRRGERQSGPAGAGAEVGDPARPAYRRQLERDQRVGHMPVDSVRRLAHRRRSGRVSRLEFEDRLERRRSGGRERVAAGELVQMLHAASDARARTRVIASA